MSIEKLTIQQSLNTSEYTKFYSRISHETAETFDIDSKIKERFVQISDKAIERNKRLSLPSPEMERIINRIKTSQLSYKRKELLLRQVWAKVRTESLKDAEGSAKPLSQSSSDQDSNSDFEQSFIEMIRTFESVEKRKLDFKDLSKDMRKIDDLVVELSEEDEQFSTQKDELNRLVNQVKAFDHIAKDVVAGDWNFDPSISLEN